MSTERERELYVFSEASAFVVFADILMGRRPVVLYADPLLRVSGPLLDRILRFLRSRDLVHGIDTISSRLPWLAKVSVREKPVPMALSAAFMGMSRKRF